MSRDYKIDFNKVVSVDDMTMGVVDPIKGLEALLSSLNLSDGTGQHKYSECGFLALLMVCEKVIENSKEISEGIEYMHSTLVEVNNSVKV